jgi:hypothetical protein
MNDEDLRDLFAAFAMISKAWIPDNIDDHAENCYALADAMIRAKYAAPDAGIASVTPKPRKVRVQKQETT